jgi:hypothetical protein
MVRESASAERREFCSRQKWREFCRILSSFGSATTCVASTSSLARAALMCLKKVEGKLGEEKSEFLSSKTRFWGAEVPRSYRARARVGIREHR